VGEIDGSHPADREFLDDLIAADGCRAGLHRTSGEDAPVVTRQDRAADACLILQHGSELRTARDVPHSRRPNDTPHEETVVVLREMCVPDWRVPEPVATARMRTVRSTLHVKHGLLVIPSARSHVGPRPGGPVERRDGRAARSSPAARRTRHRSVVFRLERAAVCDGAPHSAGGRVPESRLSRPVGPSAGSDDDTLGTSNVRSMSAQT